MPKQALKTSVQNQKNLRIVAYPDELTKAQFLTYCEQQKLGRAAALQKIITQQLPPTGNSAEQMMRLTIIKLEQQIKQLEAIVKKLEL